jgi:lipopolysaccharide biosynthesis glycosyltransferase
VRLITIADSVYLCGVFALLQSMEENSGLPPDTSLTLIHEEPLPEKAKEGLRRFSYDITFMDRRELGDVKSLRKQKLPRHLMAIKKLLIFRLPFKEKVAFLDADMLCFNALTGMEELPHLSAAPDFGKIARTVSTGDPMFNTGFLVFQPSEELYEEIMDFYHASEEDFVFGDQGILNEFLYRNRPQMVNMLDSSWNTLKPVSFYHPEQFDLSKVRLLHYVSGKPWDEGIYRSNQLPYYRLHEIWWDFFERSPGPEFHPAPRGRPVQSTYRKALVIDMAYRYAIKPGLILAQRLKSAMTSRFRA